MTSENAKWARGKERADIHGHHSCPAEALNPSVGQNALVPPLTGVWTKGATTGQTCSGQPGQGRGAARLTRRGRFIHRPAVGLLGGWRVVPGRSSLVGPSAGSELTMQGGSLPGGTRGRTGLCRRLGLVIHSDEQCVGVFGWHRVRCLPLT